MTTFPVLRSPTGPGTEFDDLPPGGLDNGVSVEVEGVLLDASTVRATKIEGSDEGPTGDFDDAEVEGFVSAFVSAASFRVNGIRVDASLAEVSGGSLANGVRVEVEGALVDGELVAERVEIEDEEAAEVEGAITRFTSVASFRVAGQQVDASGAGVEFDGGNAGDLAIGALVKVKGGFVGNVLVADKVKFEDQDDNDD